MHMHVYLVVRHRRVVTPIPLAHGVRLSTHSVHIRIRNTSLGEVTVVVLEIDCTLHKMYPF